MVSNPDVLIPVSVYIFIFGFWKKRERVTKQSGYEFAGMKGGGIMKKNLKKRKTSSLAKHKKRKQNTNVKQFLGLGPKIVNSVIIALNENDRVHAQKIVEGLSEYDLAKLLEVLDYDQRRQLVEFLGDRINPDVFPN